MSNNWRQKFFKLVSLPTFVSCVLIVILVHVVIWILLVEYLPTWEERAHFGEMFVVTHSLFDGLALVALIFTILIQQSEIKSQKLEAKKTVMVQKTLVEVLAITAQLNAQYSLLDSKNRAHDRSLKNSVPREQLNTEVVGINNIECNISDSVENLKDMLATFEAVETVIDYSNKST